MGEAPRFWSGSCTILQGSWQPRPSGSVDHEVVGRVVYGRVLKSSLAPGKGNSALPTLRSATLAPNIVRPGVSKLRCWPGRLARGDRGFWRISCGEECQQKSVDYR